MCKIYKICSFLPSFLLPSLDTWFLRCYFWKSYIFELLPDAAVGIFMYVLNVYCIMKKFLILSVYHSLVSPQILGTTPLRALSYLFK